MAEYGREHRPQRFEDLERQYGHLDDESFFAVVDSYDPALMAEKLSQLDWEAVPDAERRADGESVLVQEIDEEGVEQIGMATYKVVPSLHARARHPRDGDA